MWRATMSGFSASLVGIGLARFAYTPLLPAIVGAHWFAPSTAAYLGAANLAGYLAGAVLARPLAARVAAAPTLNAMMMLATVAFVACAYPLSFFWFFAWRVVSGAAGGVLMVLAATTVLPHVTPSRRGFAGGVIFMGVGAGIVAAAPGLGPDLARPRHCLPHTDLDRLARLAERDEAGGDITQPAPHARDPWFARTLRRVRTQRRRAGAAHGLSG
jgi:predicted MFS family arabinose efflux permease